MISVIGLSGLAACRCHGGQLQCHHFAHGWSNVDFMTVAPVMYLAMRLYAGKDVTQLEVRLLYRPEEVILSLQEFDGLCGARQLAATASVSSAKGFTWVLQGFWAGSARQTILQFRSADFDLQINFCPVPVAAYAGQKVS